MKYDVIERYAWYFPDEGIEVSVYREPTYFRRFVMWLFLNAELRTYYKTLDTCQVKIS
mgnify:CR=1 FL=1|jgi:hypothetical protein